MKALLVFLTLTLNSAMASPYDEYVCKEAGTDAYVVIDRHDTIFNQVTVTFGRLNIIGDYIRSFERTDLSTYGGFRYAYQMANEELTAELFLNFRPFFENDGGQLVLRLRSLKGEELIKEFSCKLHEFIR